MKHLLLASIFAMNSLAVFAKPDRIEAYPESTLDIYSTLSGLDMSLKEAPIEQQKVKFGPTPYQHPHAKSYFVPFKLDGNELVKIAAASTVAVMVFASDREIMDFTQKHQNSLTENLAVVGEAFGSEWGSGAAAAGIIVGIVMKNQEIKHVSIMAAKAMLVSGLATRALKMSVTRTRPNDTENPYEFDAGDENHSFPSGHTTQAFALATVIAEAGKERSKFIPILAYSMAAIAGWSRTHDKAHWASDVIVGGLIGHLIAKNMMNSELTKKGFMIVPHIGLQGDFAVNVTYTGKAPELKCGKNLTGVEAFKDCMDKSFGANKPISLF